MELKRKKRKKKRKPMIKKSNPIAKEVRTPKFKPRVIASKKIYNRKKLNDKEK